MRDFAVSLLSGYWTLTARRGYKMSKNGGSSRTRLFRHGKDDSARATAGTRPVTHVLLSRRQETILPRISGGEGPREMLRERLNESAGPGRLLPQVDPELEGGGLCSTKACCKFALDPNDSSQDSKRKPAGPKKHWVISRRFLLNAHV